MYNMIFGVNPNSDVILACLGLRKQDVGRFRDAFVANGEIAVYTRNGGSNRECCGDECDTGNKCYGCIITKVLPKHPHYLRDKDDDFDDTYATIYFSIPPEFRELLAKLDSGHFDPDARWYEGLEALKGMSSGELKSKYPQLCEVLNTLAVKLK